MAAYASLVSLMHLVEQIQLYHVHHSNFLKKHQKQLESLHERVANLHDLLEWCSNKGCNEIQGLESQILHAANGAEDLIELYIVGDIHHRSWKNHNSMHVREADPVLFPKELQKVIRDMYRMAREMINIKDKNMDNEDYNELPDLISPKSPHDGIDDMVGFEEEFSEIMNKLMGQDKNLKIISVTGMGGIGKSTLVKNVYENRSIMNYFDVRGWIIISQEFSAKRGMFDLLKETGVLDGEYHDGKYDYHQLGEKLHNHLIERRFLIIMDDMWSVKDWEKLKLFLPRIGNGSRIVLTTRFLNVAKEVGCSHIYRMHVLDENRSWSLLCRKIFLNETCPPPLLDVGKKIVRSCKGLPLLLSLIGGLLAKLKKTRECWESIARDISMIVSSEDGEHYLNIISLSYSHLPIHLKPCFLHLGIFPEEHNVDVESLIDIWVSEGFLKPCGAGRSLEDVARIYIEDLIERSLVYVSRKGNTGKVESIRIHDLVRNLALTEAQKQKFLHVTALSDPKLLVSLSERRVILKNTSSCKECVFDSESDNDLSTLTFVRSLMCDSHLICPVSPSFNLLRVSQNVTVSYSSGGFFHLINSRHLRIDLGIKFRDLSSIHLLWNLQTIYIDYSPTSEMEAAFPIWEMPLLRKFSMSGVTLHDPPRSRMGIRAGPVLTNLQNVSSILDFRCTDAVVRRICNIKELVLMHADQREKGISHYCLNNLDRLHKLEGLQIWFVKNMERSSRIALIQNIGFSQSLKRLFLLQCGFEWENLTTKVGSLPHLEELKLYDCCTGEEWISEEGSFQQLKILEIRINCGLVRWSAESNHFPCLEHLFLSNMLRLEEIPSDIGDIATLQSIQLKFCSDSVVASAKTILKEQRELHNESLRVLVDDKHVQVENESKGKKKRKTKGYVAFVVLFMVIYGLNSVLNHKKFEVRGRGGDRKDKQKKEK